MTHSRIDTKCQTTDRNCNIFTKNVLLIDRLQTVVVKGGDSKPPLNRKTRQTHLESTYRTP